MIKVDQYERIRKAYHVEGLSIREISRQYRHGRTLIRKTLEHAVPEPYQVKTSRNGKILGQYRERIQELLIESEKQPRKQRYTSHKIYEILAKEGYSGSEGYVHNHISEWKKKTKAGKSFLPLEFDAGQDAQVDWGEAYVIMAGIQIKVQFFTLRLNFSRVRFVKAYPFQKQEAFLEGHESAFDFIKGVPQRITYDNLKVAVFKILEGHTRQEQDAFIAFRSFYLFDSYYCTPAQGHEKGGVENDVGYVQRNFFAPLLRVNSFEELNQILLEYCQNNMERHVRGQTDPVAKLLELDMAHLLPLPKQVYPACVNKTVKANPYSQVVYDTNRYSVPNDYTGKQLVIRAYPFKIEVISLEGVIASHSRSFGREQDILDPMHYISLLEQRPGAFEHTLPIRQWRKKWPACYEQLLQSLRDNKPEGQGIREFISLLKLHQTYPSEMLEKATSAAVLNGMMGLDGVMYHLQRLVEPVLQIPAINLSSLPLLENVGCQPVDLHIYDQLVGGR